MSDDIQRDDDRPRKRRREEFSEEDDRPRRRRRRDDDEDDDDDGGRYRNQGDATGGIIPYKNPQALIAYYCAVFSLVCGLLAPVAIILGITGLMYKKKHPTASGTAHAIVGIVLGSIVTLAYIGMVAAISLGLFK